MQRLSRLTVAEDLAVYANLTAESERTTYMNKLWESWGYFIDPGAQSSVDPNCPKAIYKFAGLRRPAARAYVSALARRARPMAMLSLWCLQRSSCCCCCAL